jgi:uncharacterized damage-inducible protein DinB
MGGSAKAPIALMSRYHLWANERLVTSIKGAVKHCNGKKIYRNNDGSYFGSIKNTLAHIAGVDDLWYLRITKGGDSAATYNYYYSDGTPPSEWGTLYNDFNVACDALLKNSERWVQYVETLDDDALFANISYEDTKNIPVEKQRGAALLHVFNHGTHHRGQIHTALTSVEQGAVRQFAPALDMPLMESEFLMKQK